MNVPSHISGQIPGQMVPSQGISRLPGLSQQNGGGGSLASQLQNMGGVANVEPDFVVARSMMREKITQYIQGRSVPTRWQQNLPDIVKRLEEWLFKHAPSKEEYLNMETFESRLITISKNLNNLNQQMITHRSPSSAPISTMIPTPGMSHGGSSNVIATGSADTSVTTSSSPGTIMATSIGTGNIIQSSNGAAPTGNNGSFNASDANHSIGSMPPMALSYSSSHMIPTPGLNNTQSMSLSSGGNGGGYSGVESTRVQQQQKQFIGNQNSRILQNLGGQIGAGVRNSMQQRYRFPNGGLTYMSNNSQLMNGPVVSEGSLSTTAYHNSPRPSQQQHQSLCTRDSYGVNNLAGIGNLYTNAPSTGSTLNSQNINSLNLQPRSKPNAASQSYQHNLQSIQQTGRKPPLLDNAQKMEFQSTHSAPEAYVQNSQSFQKLQQQQFQSQTSQPYAQFSQNQFQPQQQLLVENDQLRQPFVTSSINRHLMSEQGMNSVSESLLLQDSEEFKFSVLSGFRQNPTVENSSVGSRSVSQLSDSQNMKPSLVQDPQQNHQIYRPNQHSVESQNNLNSLSNGCQPEVLLQGQWPSQAQKSHILDQTSFQSHIQSDFQPQMIGKSAGLQIHNPLDGSGPVASITNGIAIPKQSSFNSHDFGNSFRAQQYYHQRRWLLFLHHARYCGVPKGKCKETYCSVAQDLVLHMGKCDAENCTYRYCKKSKTLLKHFFECKAADCPVCIYVRDFCSKHKPHPLSDAACVQEKSNTWEAVNALDAADKPGCKTSLSSMETSEDIQSAKRLKMDHMSVLGSKGEVYSMPAHETGKHLASQEAPVVTHPLVAPVASANSKVTDIKIESSTNFALENPPVLRPCKIDDSKYISSVRASECQDKLEKMQIDKDFDKPKVETKQEIAVPVDSGSGTKSGKPKIKGVSLTELFTPEQVREHIIGLRQWVGQSRAKAEKNQAMEHSMSDNSCQLCAVEKLTFEPPPIYCSICGTRIKRNAMYYTCGSSDTRQYFCIPCHNDARGDSIEVEGITIPKARLEKKRNDEETEEWWVQCDKCEAWQHQICALFNGRRNEGGQAEYTCPNCYVQEVERGERRPLPQSAVLGADDLPKTLLSDHLEQRLLRRLKQERQERARSLGKSFDEVLGAEALVIRVVSSVDKKLDVKQRFLEIFQDNYPTEFPYKSKVVLLFQKIEGVEVCLFGMYVQEFGSECQFPNQRRVYLSYLDSVKYFRPEIKTVTGEALRTFVYHEILIGYLDYCKKRGFTSCYIWACPPLKGEDYILYCHPEIQKTPKSDKLREWYLSMLRKAIKENIVASLTNLYDHFFVTVGECKAKVTAARLPYFDGDYWPGAAEDMINQLQQEEDGRKQQKKGKTKKTITKRALKAAGQTDLSGNASKDALLMQKLGETICPMKEDFIMVHLQHACSHCCLLMVSGFRWVCNQCKNFQLCEKCYDAEQKREERERHPINSREKHLLKPIEIDGVPSDTKDRDEILESEFFDTRQAFLSLCQGNHYQFDTLRRAKHSSMMVLYHLHNPTAPAFVTTCNICHHDIETGQGWRCETCTDFDVCNSCYKRDGGAVHPHKLTTHPSMMDAQNTEARQKRVAELRKMLNLLVHASKCRASPHQPLQCQYPDCRKVKGLFRHGRICKVRASGGCVLCKRMWYLLQLHARACKESECHVPRCKDLKEHLKRLQQQSDSRRRAAVMEMMRQRAAEVAACS